MGGCSTTSLPAKLPEQHTLVRDQLVIHSDFHVPRRHRLLDELTLRRNDIADQLSLPISDEPINVFLFENEERFRTYLKKRFPSFPDRRAFFVKTDTELKVFAYWGQRVAEDLRHEVTHGYLHSTIPNLPLWMDEGLAEYFEVPRGRTDTNSPHVVLLARKFRKNEWQPDLPRLEQIAESDVLNQTEYAESWLWIHFLLNHSDETRELLKGQIEIQRLSAKPESIYEKLANVIPGLEERVIEHLRNQAQSL